MKNVRFTFIAVFLAALLSGCRKSPTGETGRGVQGFWKGMYSNNPATPPDQNYLFELFRSNGNMREFFGNDTLTINKTGGVYTITSDEVNWTTDYTELGGSSFSYTAILSDNEDTLTGTWGYGSVNDDGGRFKLTRQ